MSRRSTMHAQPPRVLKRLLKQYGQELVEDPRRTEALLRDLCGQYPREIFVLVNAQKQRVPADLLAAPAWMPRLAVHTRLSRYLQAKLALTEDAADWAVAAWATALELTPTIEPPGLSWLSLGRKPAAGLSSGPSPRKMPTKKRQTGASGVQSGKEPARKSKRRYTLVESAELPWYLSLYLTLAAWLRQLRAMTLPHFHPRLSRQPWLWATLVSATVLLLLVVFWQARDSAVFRASSAAELEVVATPTLAAVTTTAPPGASDADAIPLSPSAYLAQVLALPNYAQVTAPLNIRAVASLDGEIVGGLVTGTPVNVTAFSDDGTWAEIAAPRLGWVSTEFLEFENPGPVAMALQVRVRQLRTTRPYDIPIFNDPVANQTPAGTLPPNTPVLTVAETVDQTVNWLYIVYPLQGWATVNDLPPVEVATSP